ncbi:MAG: energy transducer TonB [Bacteroidota bacterium]
MKETITLLFSIYLLVGASGLLAQESMVYTHVDQMPFFPGCEDYKDQLEEKRTCSNQSLITYVAENLHYPESAKNEGVEGTVIVSFVVDEDGIITEPYLIRDIGGGCGEVALNIIRQMPRWEAGIHDGEAVKVKLNLPIQFNFKDQNDDQANKFTLNWGLLKGKQISKATLEENFERPIIIRNELGDEVSVVELSFSFERKKSFYEKRSAGQITAEVKKILKKVKKGGRFALTATIQQQGEFIYVRRVYDIIE